MGEDEELVTDEGFEGVSDSYEVVKGGDYVVVKESLSAYPPLGYSIFSELIRDYIRLREGLVRGRGYLVIEGGVTYFSPLPHVMDSSVVTYLPKKVLKELIKEAGYSVPYVELVGYLRFVGKGRSPLLEVRDVALIKPPKVRTLSFNEYEGLVLDGIEVKFELRDLYLLHPISSPGLRVPRNPIPPGLHATYVGKYVSVISWVLSNYHPSRATKYFRLVKTSLSRFKGIRKRKSLAEIDTLVKSSSLSNFIDSAPNVDFLVIIDECPSSKDLAKDLLSIKYSYDITNYLLTTRLTSPYPVITDEVMDYVGECAEALARAVAKANIPRGLVGKGKYLDLTYLGRPATVLRLAQSMVRAGIKDDLRGAINESMNTLLATVRVIEEEVSTGKFFKKHPEILHDEALILKLVEDIEASKGCATAKDIKEELRIKVKDPTLERHLDMILESLTRKGYLMYLMKREGRCYKIVPP